MTLNNFMRDLMGQIDDEHVLIVPDNATTPSSELVQQTCCNLDSRRSVSRSRSLDIMSKVFSVEHTPETIGTAASQCRWDDMFFNQSDSSLMTMPSRDSRWRSVSRYSSADSVLLKKPTRTSCMPIAEPVVHTVERKYSPTSLIISEKESSSSQFGFGLPTSSVVPTETLIVGETSSNASQSQHTTSASASLELLPMTRKNFEQPLNVLSEKVKPKRFSFARFISICAGGLGGLLIFASAFVLSEVVGPALLTPASQLLQTISYLAFSIIAPEKYQYLLPLYRGDRGEPCCIDPEQEVALLDHSNPPPRRPKRQQNSWIPV